MPTRRERTPLSAAVALTARAERAVKGWSQKDLAQQSGISYDSIRRIESGERVADISQVERLAAAFGYGLTEFLRLAEPRIASPEPDDGNVTRDGGRERSHRSG